MAYCGNHHTLVTASADMTLLQWHLDDIPAIKHFTLKSRWPTKHAAMSMCWSSSHRLLYSGTTAGTIQGWSLLFSAVAPSAILRPYCQNDTSLFLLSSTVAPPTRLRHCNREHTSFVFQHFYRQLPSTAGRGSGHLSDVPLQFIPLDVNTTLSADAAGTHSRCGAVLL